MTPKIVITEDCTGTGQCVMVAPDLFDLDPDGLSTVISEPDTSEELELAQRAARLCPMEAIKIET